MATISKHDKNSLKLFYLIFYKVDFTSFERMKKLSINDCGHVIFSLWEDNYYRYNHSKLSQNNEIAIIVIWLSSSD